MVSKVKENKVNFKGKMVNIDVDMHKLFWQITALVEGDMVLAVTHSYVQCDNFREFTYYYYVQKVLKILS